MMAGQRQQAPVCPVSAVARLRSSMELCSQIVSDAYVMPAEQLLQFEGELPPHHNASHRRQK